ncbi:NERD domain-containing protein [Metabacillus sp. RGM 3146]|uniref:NERD domain-containing protein n=1 Tax=Metabacillus sp. RGM 3146 TaxID=3401092 RepID=UPI003B9D3D39
MAQLIKLYDYISRYEMDPYRYPGQFIRMKKQQWRILHEAWKTSQFDVFMKKFEGSGTPEEGSKPSLFTKIKGKLVKSNEDTISIEIPPLIAEAVREEEFDMQFTTEPRAEEDLKHLFLDKIFQFQLKWASSTLRDKSQIDRALYRNKELKFFLQRFPDQYLFMYKPVFKVKQAVTELDLLFILPSEILCMTLLKGEKDSVFIGSNDHFWQEKTGRHVKKVLNPQISLNRAGTIISNMMQSNGIGLPVKKLLISQNSYIDHPSQAFDLQIIDKRTFEKWFQQLRSASSPVKHIQLKAVKVLFDYTVSDSYPRSEWNKDSAEQFDLKNGQSLYTKKNSDKSED